MQEEKVRPRFQLTSLPDTSAELFLAETAFVLHHCESDCICFGYGSPVLESLFSLRPTTLLKKTLQRRCFPVNFTKILRTGLQLY